MVNVRTAAEDNLQIHVKDVEILNIDENKIGRKEFERLVSRFPNLQDLMQYTALKDLQLKVALLALRLILPSL